MATKSNNKLTFAAYFAAYQIRRKKSPLSYSTVRSLNSYFQINPNTGREGLVRSFKKHRQQGTQLLQTAIIFFLWMGSVRIDFPQHTLRACGATQNLELLPALPTFKLENSIVMDIVYKAAFCVLKPAT